MRESTKRRIVRDAVDLPRMTMPQLANITGCSASSLRAYRTGYRIPTEESVKRIVTGLRSHANALNNLADKLETIHGKTET